MTLIRIHCANSLNDNAATSMAAAFRQISRLISGLLTPFMNQVESPRLLFILVLER